MDPLTHTLFGATLAEAGLARQRALGYAALIVGANLPDVDVLSYVRGADFALGFRRGWTHGLPALVIWPVLLAGALVLVDRWWSARSRRSASARFGPLLRLSAIAVVSHPLLDWLNTYGVRFLMPIDGRWFYGDTLFIIDPWLWLLFGGALFIGRSHSQRALGRWLALAALTSLVILLGPGSGWWTRGVWLGVLAGLACWRWRSEQVPPVKWPRRALAVAAIYVTAMWSAMVWARQEVRARLPDLSLPSDAEVMVGPLPTQIGRRMVLIATDEAYHFGIHDAFASPRLRLDPVPRPKNLDHPLAVQALDAPCIAGLATWLRFPFAELLVADPPRAGQPSISIAIEDARYSPFESGGFARRRLSIGANGALACADEPP